MGILDNVLSSATSEVDHNTWSVGDVGFYTSRQYSFYFIVRKMTRSNCGMCEVMYSRNTTVGSVISLLLDLSDTEKADSYPGQDE